MQDFGPESISVMGAGANIASEDLTAGRTNEEITINCFQGTLVIPELSFESQNGS
jgi:hypothetical protein